MNLTGTKNSVLSKAISFDPSYISRIRTGKRSMPETPQFIEPVAAYFSRNIRTDYQRSILAAELNPEHRFPDSREELQAQLEAWLYETSASAPDAIGGLLNGFSAANSLATGASGSFTSDMSPEKLIEAIRNRSEQLEKDAGQSWFFYGNSGKRRAVELFLGRLCCRQQPFQLLLFSDEEMSWLYEDATFAKRWAALLFRLLTTGSRIRIPHYTSRGSSEMFEAVQKWIPLYLTGAIEPYYFPRLRDGVYRRSLFIAEGDSALISTSIGNETDGMLNILLDDKQAVAALEKEYAAYLSLCRPLMQIYRAGRGRDYFQASLRFEKEPGDMVVSGPIPSLFTMPQAALQRLQLRCTDPAVSENHARSYAAFREHMRRGEKVTEILNLPNPADVRNGKVPMPLCDFYDSPRLSISPDELALHLKNVIRLLKREKNYDVVLSAMIPQNIILSAKEQYNAGLLSAVPPTAAFLIQEPGMTLAFWEYLLRIAELSRVISKEQTIRQLETYTRALEK